MQSLTRLAALLMSFSGSTQPPIPHGAQSAMTASLITQRSRLRSAVKVSSIVSGQVPGLHSSSALDVILQHS